MEISGSKDKEKWPATLWDSGAFSKSEVNVPVEKPIDLVVDGKALVVLHCTPQNLEELAAGFLLGRGFISSVSQIDCIEVDPAAGRLVVVLKKPLKKRKGATVKTVIYSGCSQGPINVPVKGDTGKVPAGATFASGRLREGLSKTLSRGKIYRETRGVHSAAICSRRGGVMALREDIGRHNALDKVLGWASARCLDPGIVFVAVSGRISAEAVEKMAVFRIPVLVSKGLPTSMALELAEGLGVTVASGMGSKKLRVYTHSERIKP